MVHNEVLQSTASAARTHANERLVHEAVGCRARLGSGPSFRAGEKRASSLLLPFLTDQG